MKKFVLCHRDISQDEDLQTSSLILKRQLTDQQWSDLLKKRKECSLEHQLNLDSRSDQVQQHRLQSH